MRAADSYVHGGQDWGSAANPGCTINASYTQQSPINMADQVVTFGAALPALNVSYGATASWMLEITGAHACATLKPFRPVRGLRCGPRVTHARLAQPTTWRWLTSIPTPPPARLRLQTRSRTA